MDDCGLEDIALDPGVEELLERFRRTSWRLFFGPDMNERSKGTGIRCDRDCDEEQTRPERRAEQERVSALISRDTYVLPRSPDRDMF